MQKYCPIISSTFELRVCVCFCVWLRFRPYHLVERSANNATYQFSQTYNVTIVIIFDTMPRENPVRSFQVQRQLR